MIIRSKRETRMSEENVSYIAGGELTLHSLIEDLHTLRAEQEQVQRHLQQMARMYPSLASNMHFQQIDARTTMSLISLDEVIRVYQNKHEQAEEENRP